MDKFYEDKKRRGLIFTEAHLREGGSNNNMPNNDSPTAPPDPYTRDTGASQWDRQKKRYRTYEEQLAYQKQVEANQSAAALVVKEGHHCRLRHEAYRRRKVDGKFVKDGELSKREVRSRWRDK